MCFDIGVVTCGPNEALIISGVFYGNRPNMLVGGRAIVCPCIQMVQRIPLSTMTLIIESPRVYTSQGVPISVTGVAQVQRDYARGQAELPPDGGKGFIPVSISKYGISFVIVNAYSRSQEGVHLHLELMNHFTVL